MHEVDEEEVEVVVIEEEAIEKVTEKCKEVEEIEKHQEENV